MRARSLVLGLVLSLAGALGPGTPAGAAEDPRVQHDEGPLVGAWVEVFYPGQPKPRGARVQLVQPGEGPARRRFPVRRRRYHEDDQSLAGRVAGRLENGVAYDVEITTPGSGTFVLPGAFTARAPRFAPLAGTTAARGEVVWVELEFALPGTRFSIAGRRAPVRGHVPGDTWYGLRVPPSIPGHLESALLTATAPDSAVAAPDVLTLVAGPRKLEGLVDGRRRACATQDWSEDAGRLLIQGTRQASADGRTASEGYVLSLSVPFASLEAGATYTEADGTWVETFNLGEFRRAFPGKQGVFHSVTCSVTIHEIEGSRIHGTFTAHATDRGTLTRPPDGRTVEVTEGQFVVDPAPPRRN